MHTTVGISIGPWLITTGSSAAAASSVGSLSKWTSPAASFDVRLLWPSVQVDRRVLGCHNVQEVSHRTLERQVDSLLGIKPRNEWGWKRRQPGLGLLLRDSVKDERAVLHTRARRGFLTELANLKDEEETSTAGSVEFESPLQIVLYPDPRLRNKNSRVTVFDEKLQQLVKEMFEIMYKTGRVGLAAPQVGANVQLMLYNPEGEKGKGTEYILVNPKIVNYSKQHDVFREGCLSFSTLEADVERPYSVRVEAQDIRGKKFGISLKGWQARIFQHEYDHLEGVLYHDRMMPSQVDTIRAGLVKLEETYEKQTGLPRPEKVQEQEIRSLRGEKVRQRGTDWQCSSTRGAKVSRSGLWEPPQAKQATGDITQKEEIARIQATEAGLNQVFDVDASNGAWRVSAYGDQLPNQAESVTGATTIQAEFKSLPDLDYLQELLAIQQSGPRAIGFFGTRNMGFMHQQLIEILSYAMVITKNHIYTSGASGTNAAVIRGALRAERPDLLTVILPQSLQKQPPESQDLLSKVKNVIEMSHNDHLPLLEASRLCNMDILSHVQQVICFAFHDSNLLMETCREAKGLRKIVTLFYLD